MKRCLLINTTLRTSCVLSSKGLFICRLFTRVVLVNKDEPSVLTEVVALTMSVVVGG